MLEFQQSFLRAVRPEDGLWLLFEHLRDVFFFVKDLEGRIILANRQLLDHYGIQRPDDFIGKTDFDVLPRSLAEKYRADDEAIARTATPLPRQIELFVDEDGIPDWYLTAKRPVFDSQSRVIGIMGVIQKFGTAHERSFDDQKLAKAVAYLREHFVEQVHEAELTKIAGVKARQLQRMFKSKLNTSFRGLIVKMRVHKACDLLRLTDRSLSEIAGECGFYDQSSFNRHFRTHMGMTPRQYRQRW